ncbi:unnamed protein product [Arctia plantaginis]|uniref:Uncharacterized protein n=1 Tax=Arctia plantaginis TaxID=874455 RepID=A0A8S1A4V2_ARCPL|nr:unnamed protein product [Arctia plantaginis]
MPVISTGLQDMVLAQNDGFTLPDSISLPPELQQKLNDTEIEQVKNQYMEQFKQKCEKNGHPEAYEKAQNAVQGLMACSSALVDTNTLQTEIENAKPNGKLDEVFKKYCDKTPQFNECFRNMTETVKPCFTTEEQENFKIIYNVTDQLVEFICFKDGDRIALFIAEGGQECFQDKQEGLQNCFNQTLDAQTQSDLKNITIDSDFKLEFKEKQCNQMTEMQKCIVSALSSCPKSTSANIVDSLFNFIRSATPCKDFKKAEKKGSGGGASGLTVTSGMILIALATALLV